MRNSLRSFVFTAAVPLLLAGCGLFSDSTPPQQTFQSPVSKSAPEAKETTPPANQSRQYIEVVWQIPTEKVDGYVIRYGTSAGRLANEVQLRADDAQRVHHEKYGEVFRYLIPNQPTDQTIYVSVAAVSNGHESAPSKVFEVAPETPVPDAPAAPSAPPALPPAAK